MKTIMYPKVQVMAGGARQDRRGSWSGFADEHTKDESQIDIQKKVT